GLLVVSCKHRLSLASRCRNGSAEPGGKRGDDGHVPGDEDAFARIDGIVKVGILKKLIQNLPNSCPIERHLDRKAIEVSRVVIEAITGHGFDPGCQPAKSVSLKIAGYRRLKLGAGLQGKHQASGIEQ